MISGDRKKIGKYEVLDVIGRGGMGVIYKAIDPGIGRTVAIKMTTGSLGEDPEMLTRFNREAQSAGNLQHPNIVTVYDLGVEDGNPYLVMELLDGESLESLIRSHRVIPVEEDLDIVIQICKGLNYAHQRNVIHRDIKPANIMILKDGTTKIVDFGIARIGMQKLTRPGQLVGSFEYMSPEQFNAANVDSRTDIFSLGVVLFQLVTGKLPFEGKDIGEMLLKTLHDSPPSVDSLLKTCPRGLNDIVQRALAKNPEQRYQTAEDLAFDLERVLESWRRERVSEYLQGAETAIAQRQWGRAKEQLLQVLKRDRQNSQAVGRLREVQDELQKQQSKERAKELLALAEQSLTQSDFNEALTYLNEAVGLDSGNHEVLQLRDSVQENKTRSDKLQELMKRAELAQDADDIEGARQAVEEGLALDPHNTDFRSMQVVITKELAGRDKQNRVQKFVGEARKEISSRHFTAALDALKKAELLDPSLATVQQLIALAKTGRQQEQRRLELERLTAQIEEALERDDYATASARIEKGLLSYSNDRGLLKLKAVIDKQRIAVEESGYVEQQTNQARTLLDSGQTNEALALLKVALEKYPSEPSLEAMVTLVKQSIEKTRKEQQKAETIQSTRDAIRRKAYVEAISILEAARKQTASTDYDELLQFAQNEAENQVKRQKIDAVAKEAQRMTSEDKYPEAIALLKATLREFPDQELQIILADIQRHYDEFNTGMEKAVANAERLLRQDRYAEAIKFLEGQNVQYGKATRVQEALEHIRRRQQEVHEVSELKEEARSALAAGDIGHGMQLCQEFRSSRHPSEPAALEVLLLEQEIGAKQAEAANTRLAMALRDARLLITVGSFAAALSVLESVESTAPFAAPEFRQRFEALQTAANASLARKAKVTPQPGAASALGVLTETGDAETQLADPDHLQSMLGEVSLIEKHYQDNSKIQSAIHSVKQEMVEKISVLRRESVRQTKSKTLSSHGTEKVSSKIPEPAPNLVPPLQRETTAAVDRPAVRPTAAIPAEPDRKITKPPEKDSLPRGPVVPPLPPVSQPDIPLPAPNSTLAAKPARGFSAAKSWTPGGLGKIAIAAALAVVVLVIALSFRGKQPAKVAPAPIASEFAVRIRTSPSGATILINNKIRGVSDLSLAMPGGTYQLEAELNGYESAETSLDIKAGSTNSIDLTLRPLRSVLKVSSDITDGRMVLDDRPAIDLGTKQGVLNNIAAGDHKLTLESPQRSASFSFSTSAGTVPAVVGKIVAKQVVAVVVANLGQQVHVYCSAPDAEVRLDDQPSAKFLQNGLQLPPVAPGTHQLLISSAGDQYKLAVETGPVPTLMTFLQSEKDIGSLLIVTHEDGATVFVNGKPVKTLTRDGQLRIPDLGPKEYVIRVAKAGFQDALPQKVVIRNGEQRTLIFPLVPVPRFASLSIHDGVPGTQIFLDDKPVGTVQADRTLRIANINPGQHVIVLRKDGFEAKRLQKRLLAGSETAIAGNEALLQPSSGMLRVEFSPADAQVTLTKSGQPPVKVTNGISLSLPPGLYTLTARTADDVIRTRVVEIVAGQSRSVELSLAPAGMSKWDDPSGWKADNNAYVRKGGGFALFGATPTSGTFSFSAVLQKGKRLQWVLNYSGPGDYILFQTDENYFYRSIVHNGKATDETKIPHKTQKKSAMTLQILVTPGEIVHRVKDGNNWVVLDKLSSSGPSIASGKFGFNLPGKDQIAITNFKYYPDLDVR